MGDILRGTIGKFLQIILSIIGLLCLAGGFMSCMIGETGQGFAVGIIGVLFLSASFGIKYWLGYIFRQRR